MENEQSSECCFSSSSSLFSWLPRFDYTFCDLIPPYNLLKTKTKPHNLKQNENQKNEKKNISLDMTNHHNTNKFT